MSIETDELTESNFKRINIINWLLTVPLLILFSWPYYELTELFEIEPTMQLLGALTFALPFLITILHGHVTMAIGALHRYMYYDWLVGHPITWGLLFNKIMIRTRFRILCVAVSIGIFLIGVLA